MPYDNVFGGVLEGLLTSQQIQRRKAAEIADAVFREKQLEFSTKQFDAGQKQQGVENDLAFERSNREWMKLQQDMTEAENARAKADADRKSREAIAKIRADTQKDIADAKNLTLEERFTLTEAMRHGDTPEAAAGLQDWIRGRLKNGSPAPPLMPTPSTAPATAHPGPPGMNGPAAAIGSDLWNTLNGPQAPGAAIDPTKPFGGTAGAQTRSRIAYADNAEQNAKHLQEKFNFDALKANATVNHQNAVTAKLKTMTPIERDLMRQKIVESKERIKQKAAEIAAKERNTQWEHTYKNSALSLRKGMVGGSLDSLRTRMSTAGSKMLQVGKEQDTLIAEIERLSADRDKRQPSLVGSNLLDGPARDQRIAEMNARLEDVTTVHTAAKENYMHYRQVLKETGNLTVKKKPEAAPKEEKPTETRKQAGVPPFRVTLPNGIQMPGTRGQSAGQIIDSQIREMQPRSRKSAPAKTPAKKSDGDEAIKARMRKKYGL